MYNSDWKKKIVLQSTDTKTYATTNWVEVIKGKWCSASSSIRLDVFDEYHKYLKMNALKSTGFFIWFCFVFLSNIRMQDKYFLFVCFMYPSGTKTLSDSRTKQIWCTIDFSTLAVEKQLLYAKICFSGALPSILLTLM